MVYDAFHQSEVAYLVNRLRHFADDFGLRNDEVGAILRLPPGVWPIGRARAKRWLPESWQEARLRRLLEVFEMVVSQVSDEAPEWLRSPNAALFGQRPIDLLIEREDALMAFRNRLREEKGF